MLKKVLVSLVVGTLLGIIGSRILFVGSAVSLLPWSIVGLTIGSWCQKREWLLVGGCYGFALAFVFMLTGYTGSASLLSRLPFFALLGMFGGACGMLLALGGFLMKRWISLINRRNGQ